MATVELAAELEPMREVAAIIPVMNAETLPAVREGDLAGDVELSDAVERTDHVVNAEVTVRVHRPKGLTGPAPALYSMHGGGYIIGSNDMDDPKFDQWCPELGIIGVSVEYRLAPETPFPGPLDDCYAGLLWTHENAAELGIDPERIGITGVSAGGGLAAGLALKARDMGEVAVQYQLLDCPMIDDRQQTPSSQLDDLLIWSSESNTFGWQSYLGELYGTDDIPAYAAPARAEDLSNLPPAYVCVGGADGFRDEDITYAMRLYGAGVPAELHVYPGAPHGVGVFAGTEIAARYNADQLDWLKRQVAP